MKVSSNSVTDILLSPKEVSDVIRVKTSTLAAWRCNKQGPQYVRVGRLIFYKKSAIDEFISSNTHTNN